MLKLKPAFMWINGIHNAWKQLKLSRDKSRGTGLCSFIRNDPVRYAMKFYLCKKPMGHRTTGWRDRPVGLSHLTLSFFWMVLYVGSYMWPCTGKHTLTTFRKTGEINDFRMGLNRSPGRLNGYTERSNGLSSRSNRLVNFANGLPSRSNGLPNFANRLSSRSNGLVNFANGCLAVRRVGEFCKRVT